jgi:excinuclease ABC subunit A
MAAIKEQQASSLSKFDPRKYLIIKNAYQNNLKNIDLVLPHNKFIVITGVSGSGKSSLAFETLFEEGRRRYVESLSAYIRQFLGKIKKPKVDFIKGLPPAIAIEQKRSTSNSRSTVGTVTEIYHYLKLLYARAGTTYSPTTGKQVQRHSVDDVIDYFQNIDSGDTIYILAELAKNPDRKWAEELALLLQKGYTRLKINGEIVKVDEILDKNSLEKELKKKSFVLIDRIKFKKEDKEQISRIADSVQTAFFEGHGQCFIQSENEKGDIRVEQFSNDFEADGIIFEDPTPDLFSFNSPHGACPECGGFGSTLGIDEDKVVPDKTKSVYDGAILPWEGEKMSNWKHAFIKNIANYDFPLFKPYNELSEEELETLWYGKGQAEGIYAFFDFLEANTYKVHYRIFLSRFKGRAKCKTCRGSRLRKEANYVKVNNKTISELVSMPVSELNQFFQTFIESSKREKLTKRLLEELNIKLQMMVDVGLGYLTLNRTSRSLSGGELQRIQLIYSIGSNLTGSLYILDEPSIGLHPKDTSQLINILKRLQEIGNTVVVVEHDEDIIRAADFIADLGPGAGRNGGHLVFFGRSNEKNSDSLTLKYLQKHLQIPTPEKRRESDKKILIEGANKYNLKNVDAEIPLNAFTVVTGVSGSGKTTLVKEVIYESLNNINLGSPIEITNCKNISGNISKLKRIEYVSQDSIDRSKRSNPVTFLKIFDYIRELFSNQQLSKINGYTPAYFSFNVEGGRCEECRGEGKITIEMQFVADMHLTCESCKGRRYKEDILEVRYNGRNIDDVLNMTVAEGMEFFENHKNIVNGLRPLQQVGLDYLQLGQPTSTLSGGEAQRLKLAGFLAKGNRNVEHTLFIFDEPTTGLHWNDINKLLDSFNALIEIGHTILVIEHNLEIIKNADHIIDLGPEGGKFGGEVVFQGTPEELVNSGKTHTARYLKEKL